MSDHGVGIPDAGQDDAAGQRHQHVDTDRLQELTDRDHGGRQDKPRDSGHVGADDKPSPPRVGHVLRVRAGDRVGGSRHDVDDSDENIHCDWNKKQLVEAR